MIVASVEWQPDDIGKMTSKINLIRYMEKHLCFAQSAGANVIVFPAFTGLLYQFLESGRMCLNELRNIVNEGAYLAEVIKFSEKFDVIICPGSYWKVAENKVVHASCIVASGKVVEEQEQLYLANWEQKLNLTRGSEAKIVEMNGWRIGIVLGTDVFYPQVSRFFGTQGANLIFSPIGFVGEQNRWVQVSGMWEEVQQNQFFAVESGYNGQLADFHFWGNSTVLAPVEMTPYEDGFLICADQAGLVSTGIQIVELDDSKRRLAISQFNVLKQLNPGLYREMRMFEVRR